MADSTIDDRPFVTPGVTARLLQGAFATIFLAATVLLLIIEAPLAASAPNLIGAGFVAVATLLILLPGINAPSYQPWMLAIPGLDFAAFAIIRTVSTGDGTNPMVMMLTLPAVWAGLMRSRIALATIGVLSVLVVVPDMVLLARGELGEADADRAVVLIVMLPLVMILSAVAANAMASILADRQQALLIEQTRRAEAAGASERSRFLLDTVLDSLTIGVIITDPDGELILMNKVLRESPELTANGADPWESYRHAPAFDADGVTPLDPDDMTYTRVVRGETVIDRMIWVGPPGGAQRALSVSGGPVHTADSEHIANVILITEVTEFVRALEAKDAFIGTVSHELRTPLTTVAGALEVIIEQQESLPDAVAQWLPVLQRNVSRQTVLVRDLLTAAGTRTGPMRLDVSDADLAEIAADAAAALAHEITAKRLTVHLDLRSARGRLDPVRLAQVCENLLSNAVRYTPEGGTVAVVTRTVGDELELDVQDTGVGISDDDQRRLFDEFFRADSARVSATRGIGLGLSIVKAIVDAHDGRLHVESTLGEGSTFTVRLPRR
ncbi:signal transduction histidine kinase [Microcella putealis]|uniref:histidine kinase n=1 Tax=Microcella putealis TaxID=337005 RepID=A0A4Q7LNV4_9MICO|nr:ATP-binding protein [Microcella putealis]RZS56385.1 signal transduction histidine kinase [Microcella putealis]TQM27129.1 signal transduction histidine kinase [Microcella putealis]